MALNKEVFKVRATSAVLFVAIMMAGLLYNHWSFLLLFTIVHFGCWHEYLKLLQLIYKQKMPLVVQFGFMLAGYAIMLAFCGQAFTVAQYHLAGSLGMPLALAGFVLMSYGILKQKTIPIKLYASAMVGWVYISLAWGTMLLLRQDGMVFKGQMLFIDLGLLVPMLLIVSIWVNDTMAYIVGSFIGKTPFSPISPKKTWEGTIGGVILAVVGISSVAVLFLNVSLVQAIAISLTAAVAGTVGDLAESWIKRKAGVKDSGNMLPGHGGFLDRFDSLLIATPLVWLVLWLIG